MTETDPVELYKQARQTQTIVQPEPLPAEPVIDSEQALVIAEAQRARATFERQFRSALTTDRRLAEQRYQDRLKAAEQDLARSQAGPT